MGQHGGTAWVDSVGGQRGLPSQSMSRTKGSAEVK